MSRGFGRRAFILACFLFIAFVPAVVFAQSGVDGERIDRFDVDIAIGRAGEIEVTETIRYDFGSAERHGIYRDILVEYATQSADKRSMPISVRSVTDAAGQTLRSEESRTGGYLRLKIGDPDRLITGTATYVIRYEVRDAISYFDEYDELYWNATGNAWMVPIVASTVTLRLGTPIPSDRFACYLGPVGSTEPCLIADADGVMARNEFQASAPRLLPAGSGLTVALGFPKGIVREPSDLESFFRFVVDNPFVVLPFAVFGFMFRRWYRHGKDPEGRGTIVPEYEVPEGLSPLHMAALQDGRLTGKEIPAAIVDLAVKEYLVIERIIEKGWLFGTTDYQLSETSKLPATGTIERVLLDALFGTTRPAAMSLQTLLTSPRAKLVPSFLKRSIQTVFPEETEPAAGARRAVKVSELKNRFYTKIPKLQERAVSDLVARGLLAASPQEVWGKYALWGVILLVVAFFLIPILKPGGTSLVAIFITIPIYLFFAHLMPRVTREGAILKERLLGLKDYLQIAEKRRIEFHNAPEKTPELFEKLLPAALLLGVSDIWAKEFADITLAEPKWYHGGNVSSFSASSFASDLGGFNAAAGSSLASTPSSSGSGGGGFSGGGGGGGGGGSW